MRVRETNTVATPVNVHYSRKEYKFGAYPTCSESVNIDVETDSTYIPSYYYKKISDVVTPNFKRLMKKGEIVNNPLEIISYVATTTPLSWDYMVMNKPYLNQCPNRKTVGIAAVSMESTYGSAKTLSTYGSIPSINVSQMKDLAIAQAYAKIDLSEASILATLGELEETVTGLISIFKRLVGLYGRFKRKEYALILKDMHNISTLSDLYMEFRYGLRPLYYECRQLYSAWCALVNKKIPRITFRSRETRSNETSSDTVINVNDWIRCHKTSHIHREVKVSAGVLTDAQIANPLQIFGVDKGIETVWELIPYSFVIDWFINVGTTIAAWTPNAGIRNLASWICVEDTYTCSVNVGSPFSAGIYTSENIYAYKGAMSLLYKTYTREPNPSRPILPSFNIRLDPLKLVDLAILVSQLLPMKGWLDNRHPHYTD